MSGRRNAAASDAIVKARDVDMVHGAVSGVRDGRLEVEAHEGRRRVGIGGSHGGCWLTTDEGQRVLVVALRQGGDV